MKVHLSNEILNLSSARHSHLCSRQALGARIGLAGASALRLEVPRRDKRLLIILETDGCFVDGIESATGCTAGHRTLRIEDYAFLSARLRGKKSPHRIKEIDRGVGENNRSLICITLRKSLARLLESFGRASHYCVACFSDTACCKKARNSSNGTRWTRAAHSTVSALARNIRRE
ncbi:MAG: hypothetical protein JW963_25255 [Anaerolineales bacterium]|nr:hypothetical protein [Anaerolineales bacterium]